MLYRASEDGWTCQDFHRLCDDNGSTVVIAQGVKGEIFGGYTNIPWTSPPDKVFKCDKNNQTFLFSLRNERNLIEKFELNGNLLNMSTVYHNSYYGPCFGDGDLKICFSHDKEWNSSKLGSSFVLPQDGDSETYLV